MSITPIQLAKKLDIEEIWDCQRDIPSGRFVISIDGIESKEKVVGILQYLKMVLDQRHNEIFNTKTGKFERQ